MLFDFAGKRREMGLGSARDVPLSSARAKAADARKLIASGVNPLDEKRKADIPTFGVFADAYVETMRSEWRNEKHAAQWAMTLKKYAAPIRPL